jgi:multicomponent K+:H+ antiporter subunit G
MDQIFEIVIAVLLVAAGIFGIVGSFGLIKLPDTMSRLHAPTKASTLGVGGVLLASMIYFFVFENKLSWHELLITLFIFLTAPITANFIAKAHMHRNPRPDDMPETKTSRDWATYEDETETQEPVMTAPKRP